MRRERSVSSQDREKLEWRDEEVISSGAARAQITSATKRNGHKLYSVNFYREFNERRSGHFRVSDMTDIASISSQVKSWIESDEFENNASRDRSPRENRY